MKHPHLLAAFLATLVWALPVQADGLSDLKAALTRLQGQAPLRGHVHVKNEGKTNEGQDDAQSSQGQAQIHFDDGPQGLRLTYPVATLTKASQEEAALATNPKAGAPTSIGLKSLAYSDVLDMARAADTMLRDLTHAVLKSERTDSYLGQPARVLLLEVPRKKAEKFVKKHEIAAEIWINTDGTPLLGKSTVRIEGSAFLVINFEILTTEEQVFNVVGERLVATKKVIINSGSGAGQKGQGKRELSLQLG
jgi:hypothetical protein